MIVLEEKSIEANPKRGKLIALTQRLSAASCERQMSIVADHPWDENLSSGIWLRGRNKLSIAGTPYFALASEDELHRLSVLELASWWQGFISLERRVTEYYMRLINQGSFADLPEVVTYMHHFCREEINHSLVFEKAMAHYGVRPFEVPEMITDFYDDNAAQGQYPLMNVYLTLIIEWIADLYQRMDVDDEHIAPLAKTVVREHTREEARHIAWAQEMIKSLAQEVPGFLENARQFTPAFCRQFVDNGVANTEAYERVAFKNSAFQDIESLVEAVIHNDHRAQLNLRLMRPVMRFFIESGIYDARYDDLWRMAGFGSDIAQAKAGRSS